MLDTSAAGSLLADPPAPGGMQASTACAHTRWAPDF